MTPVAPVIPTITLISRLKIEGSRSKSKAQDPRLKAQLSLELCDLCLDGTIEPVLTRQRSGSVICTSCGVLVGVNDDRCYNCGRRNPGLWGFAPALRSLGGDMGFVPFVIGACATLYVLTLLASRGDIGMGSALSFFSPNLESIFLFGASGSVPVFRYGRWWTVLSAGWLHGGVLHIFFNMMAMRQLAPAVRSE